NMSCSNGVCEPTAKNAVLNAGDLETLLASGNVSVTTTGTGVEAKNIDIKTAVSWSTASALLLQAHQSITIDQPVSVQSLAAVTLTTGSKGTLSFGKHGNVTFANLSSGLTINGTAYTLENSIASLASAIAANPSGAYALANGYDASQDGTYTTVPISTPFAGVFEGLGNAISNLSINDANDQEVGLFAEVAGGGIVADISVLQADVSISQHDSCAGVLAGFDFGTIRGVSASGKV